MVLYCVILGAVASCVYLGYFAALGLLIALVGWAGHVLFLCLVALTGQPWMWGYAVTIQTSAFAYGWVSLVAMELGSFLGASLGFIASRRCLRRWVQAQAAPFSGRTRRIIDISQTKVSKGREGVFFFTLVRMTPLVAFGWANGIAGGLTDMQWGVFVPMTLLGSQLDLILNSYIGIVFRELVDRTSALEKSGDASGSLSSSSFGNGTASSNVTAPSATVSLLEEDPVGTIALLLQVMLCVLLFICSTLYGRHVLKKIVREEMEKERVTVASEVEEGGTKESSSVEVASGKSASALVELA
mgnify:CR=1 FL=1